MIAQQNSLFSCRLMTASLSSNNKTSILRKEIKGHRLRPPLSLGLFRTTGQNTISDTTVWSHALLHGQQATLALSKHYKLYYMDIWCCAITHTVCDLSEEGTRGWTLQYIRTWCYSPLKTDSLLTKTRCSTTVKSYLLITGGQELIIHTENLGFVWEHNRLAAFMREPKAFSAEWLHYYKSIPRALTRLVSSALKQKEFWCWIPWMNTSQWSGARLTAGVVMSLALKMQ